MIPIVLMLALLVPFYQPMKTLSGRNIHNGILKLVQRYPTLQIGYLRNHDYKQDKESI